MTRRSILLLGMAAPLTAYSLQPTPKELNAELANDLLDFKSKWDHWTSQLLKGINDCKAARRLVDQWGKVRIWVHGYC